MTGDEMKMNIHKNKMLWYNTRYCIRVSYERSWNMGKNLKGKEPGKGISQESTGLYSARFVEFRFAEVKKRIRGFQKFQQNGKNWCYWPTCKNKYAEIPWN